MPKPITLNQKELSFYVHLGTAVPLDQMSPENARLCRQLGLFFSVNTHLAGYAIDIEQLTLTPQGHDTPPLATVRISRKKRTYTLHSNDEGMVPDIPRRRGRWHRR